jgi:hypothetical protein
MARTRPCGAMTDGGDIEDKAGDVSGDDNDEEKTLPVGVKSLDRGGDDVHADGVCNAIYAP